MNLPGRGCVVSLSLGLTLPHPALANTGDDEQSAPPRPNIILCMTDDQGYADVGFHGHEALRTPSLDALASQGMRLNRFYAQSPVCSPTRASCLTGMHPDRLGITNANVGHLPSEVVTLAELLAAQGYATGHFGKWHLGTLTTEIRDSNRGGQPGQEQHYAPPWDHGFQICFSTEAKVPTADPMRHPDTGKPYGTRYWSGPGEIVTENLAGDDSRVIMDRVLPFVRDSATKEQPFLAVVWFHAPHLPLVATPENLALYQDRVDRAYLGALTGVDQQMGRLWETLSEAGVADNTMLWFCSDNGPERRPGESIHLQANDYENHALGSAAPHRGRKRSLYDGGVRVPAFVVWPGQVPADSQSERIACTSDYLPTIVEALELSPPAQPRDGVSLLPLIQGEEWTRPRPLFFLSRKQSVMMQPPYKLITIDDGETHELYNLAQDPGESHNLIERHAEVAAVMQAQLAAWRKSVAQDQARYAGKQP